MDKAHELIRKLGHSDDYFERQKAAWALANLGEEAVDVVAEALEKGEFSDLRYKSAWILGKTGSIRAVKPLCYSLLNDPDYVVREWSAAALVALGLRDAVQPLVLAMKMDSSKDVLLRAAMALRSLKAIEAFRELLSHSDPEIRGMAVTGLAKIGDFHSLQEVARLITDEDADLRRRAAAYMGESAKEGALEHLTIALGDADVDVRCEALKSLGKIKGDRCADLALAALADKEWKVRYAAVTSLGEIGHNKALEALVDIMFGQDDEETRAWAAWSLGEIRDERAIEPLQRAYRTCPTEVMRKAKDSLGEVFGKEV